MLKGRFPLQRKPAFCLLVAAPPTPFDRTIKIARLRILRTLPGAWTAHRGPCGSRRKLLFPCQKRRFTVAAAQRIQSDKPLLIFPTQGKDFSRLDFITWQSNRFKSECRQIVTLEGMHTDSRGIFPLALSFHLESTQGQDASFLRSRT